MANPVITFEGTLGNDPQVLPVGSSRKVRLRVVTSDRVNVDGTWTDKNTSWWTVEAWDNLADKIASHLEKGDPVMVSGTAFADSWTGRDGEERSEVVVRASDVGLCLRRYTS